MQPPQKGNKSMQYKNFVIFIIALILILVIFLSLVMWNNFLRDYKKLAIEYQAAEENHLNTLDEYSKNYNELYSQYNELYLSYQELAKQKGLDDWQEFIVTAYTSQDDGCNSYSSLGINIEKLAEHFNFCAVDPTVIPYGAIVLVQINNDITPFLAADCGGAIKGNRLDLYFDTLENAFDFGKQTAMVKVIQ